MASNSTTTHTIFDFGGVIYDTDSLAEILVELGRRLDSNWKPNMDVSQRVKESESSADVLKELYFGLNIDTKSEEMKEKLVALILEKGLRLNPGVDRLLNHLYEHNIPIAIATSNSQKWFKPMIKVTKGLNKDIIDHYVCGEDDPEVRANKPSPDVYHICFKRFPNLPKSYQNCVVFEDSLTGITGAVASGMKTVLINNRRGSDFDAIAPKITAIANSFDQFIPESVGLPPY